jgi:hypothetical protein
MFSKVNIATWGHHSFYEIGFYLETGLWKKKMGISVCRGENGSGIPVGYKIRVVQIPVFSDTDSGIFIFGTDTGNT